MCYLVFSVVESDTNIDRKEEEKLIRNNILFTKYLFVSHYHSFLKHIEKPLHGKILPITMFEYNALYLVDPALSCNFISFQFFLYLLY